MRVQKNLTRLFSGIACEKTRISVQPVNRQEGHFKAILGGFTVGPIPSHTLWRDRAKMGRQGARVACTMPTIYFEPTRFLA